MLRGYLGNAVMIRIARLDSSTIGPVRSSNGLNIGEWADVARKGLSQSAQSIERFVAQRPGFCLGAALSVGIAIGWWVKRL